MVTNAASASITGYYHAVVISGGAGAVVNDGDIAVTSTAETGVKLKSGGSVTNVASATIMATYRAIDIYGGPATVVNDGSIVAASSGTAVAFASGYLNRVTVDPGAVFRGLVNGGNPIGGAIVSTLELASGTSVGTLSGLGAKYIDFAQITIDAGAKWLWTGANTIAAGATLTELGGASLTDTGTLVNNGTIVLDPSTMTVAGLIGTGSVTIETGSLLEVQGTVAGGETVMFTGSNAFLQLDNPGSVAGSVTNFAFGDTIDLKGIDPASVSYSGGLLSFSDGSFALSLGGAGTVAVSAGAGGAVVSVQCFRAETRILTPSGERPVQQLAVGDLVRTMTRVRTLLRSFGSGGGRWTAHGIRSRGRCGRCGCRPGRSG